MDEMGKEVAAMQSAPGYREAINTGNRPIRGIYTAANGRVFFVQGFNLYEVLNSPVGITHQLRGEFIVRTNPYNFDDTAMISFSEYPDKLVLCDGVAVYIYFFAGAFTGVTTEQPMGGIAFLAEYTIGFIRNSRVFYYSEQDNPGVWPALNFAQKEGSADNIVSVAVISGFLWLFGQLTTEIWGLSGDADLPFSRVSGGIIDIGVASPWSVQDVGGVAVFVGRDRLGAGAVYLASGTSIKVISEPAIDRRIQDLGDLSKMKAFTYKRDGNQFYVLTDDNLETSLVYDLTSGYWHERASIDLLGEFGPIPAICHTFGLNMHLVGGQDGKIYEQSEEFYQIGDMPLVRERVYMHLSFENKRFRVKSLEIGITQGVGVQYGQGEDPKIMLQVSKDGGRIWSGWDMVSIGKVGQYTKSVKFRNLGIAETFTFKVRISDPVPVTIVGSYLE
jgi:hypothetical protein